MSRRRQLVYAFLILLILPQFIFWLGAGMNQVALVVNHGTMPVFLASCGKMDAEHSCMTPATNLVFLCDWINLKFAVMSPGDVLLELGAILIGPAFWLFVAFVIYQAQREPEKVAPVTPAYPVYPAYRSPYPPGAEQDRGFRPMSCTTEQWTKYVESQKQYQDNGSL